MPRQSVVPGFRFDAKTRRAHFEVTLPGRQGRVRRRKTVEVGSRDEALVLFRKFRTDALAERGKEPELFGEYVRRFWPLIPDAALSKNRGERNLDDREEAPSVLRQSPA